MLWRECTPTTYFALAIRRPDSYDFRIRPLAVRRAPRNHERGRSLGAFVSMVLGRLRMKRRRPFHQRPASVHMPLDFSHKITILKKNENRTRAWGQ
mgnify:CR=1 FL=1